MGNKFLRKMIAVFVAAAMIMTCSIGVFAASSPTKGKVTKVSSVGQTSGKKLTVSWKADKKADYYILKVGKKTYKVTGTSKTVGTKAGSSYKITVTPVYNEVKGTAKSAVKRWMKTTTITKAKSGKKKVTLTWKKAKGATKYQVHMYKGGKWVIVKTVKKTTATVKVSKKGSYKFKVTPVKGSYVGIMSKTKTGKAK